jgi:hypothetical protein
MMVVLSLADWFPEHQNENKFDSTPVRSKDDAMNPLNHSLKPDWLTLE